MPRRKSWLTMSLRLAPLFSCASNELFGSCVWKRHWCIRLKPTFVLCVPVTYDAAAR